MQDSIAKEKSGGGKWMEICVIKGGWGVQSLMANAILNFHFFKPFPKKSRISVWFADFCVLVRISSGDSISIC